MNKIYLSLFFFLLSIPLFPQVEKSVLPPEINGKKIYKKFEARAGMGIEFQTIPSLRDYLNSTWVTTREEELSDFSSAIEFSGEFGYLLNKKNQLGLEISYLLNSYNFTGFGNYQFAYSILMPSLSFYYVIVGEGYKFKFGGGAGPSFTSVDESIPPGSKPQTYNSTGFGIFLRSDANTALGDDLYANIGLDLRYNKNGEPENSNGEKIQSNSSDRIVNMDAVAIVLRLGLTYIF